MAKTISVRRQKHQRGSALLVVLVFAAIIAIMLYRELPIAAFEAQRQREELLVARGNEYKRGIKLFVRKIGRFPGSMDELENTNRIRFLRHRFVDPLTGKDDWRPIHAGPGGIILDSKVAAKTNTNSSTLGQGTTFAGFNNSFNGDAAAVAAAALENTPSAGLRQRPPPTKNAGSETSDPLAALTGAVSSPDPANPSSPPASSGVPPPIDPATGLPVQSVQNALAANGNGVTSLADQLNNTNPKVPETGLGNTSAFGNNQSGQPVQGANGSSPQPVGNQGSLTNGNQLTGGGIAGVASNAEGKGIKLVNDQSKYKLWEFYYDLRKDQNSGAAGLGQTATNPNGTNGANGTNGTNGQNQSTFGSSSTFGTSSTFGQSSAQQPPATQSQPQTPPQ
jgi:hypothetical protein